MRKASYLEHIRARILQVCVRPRGMHEASYLEHIRARILQVCLRPPGLRPHTWSISELGFSRYAALRCHTTSVCGLTLLVYAALCYQCQRPQAASVPPVFLVPLLNYSADLCSRMLTYAHVCLQFFEYRYPERRSFDGHVIIADLPVSLQKDLAAHVYR
jgi:hypothetical protein